MFIPNLLPNVGIVVGNALCHYIQTDILWRACPPKLECPFKQWWDWLPKNDLHSFILPFNPKEKRYRIIYITLLWIKRKNHQGKNDTANLSLQILLEMKSGAVQVVTRGLGWFKSICGIPWIAVLGNSCCCVMDQIMISVNFDHECNRW
jgi:hypothetical protein